MATDTPRLNLRRFDDGEDNWDHTDTVEKLDELAVQTGPIANRPASGEYDDELYYAVDERILYGWDEANTTWDERGGLGTTSSPLSSLSVGSIDNGGSTISVGDKLDLSPSRSNLRLATGQSIEDGNGIGRVELGANFTTVNDENGNFIIAGDSGSYASQLYSRSGEPARIKDSQGGFVALEYTTSANAPGTLELTNANLDLSGSNFIGFSAGRIADRASNYAFQSNGNDTLRVSDTGLTVIPNGNLRLATGQSIEDGAGTNRFQLNSGNSIINDNNGTRALRLDGNTGNDIFANSGQPLRIRDDEQGGGTAVQYISSANSPGTLELTNAHMDVSGNEIQGTDQGGGTKPALYVNSNGEWVAQDDSGNTTVIS